MDEDDTPVGRILTRREALALGGLPALTWLTGYSTASPSSATEGTGESPTSKPSQRPTTTPMSPSDPTYPSTGSMTNTSVTTSDGTTACVAQPELTEGPYYVDESIRRSDIRTDTDTGNQQPGTKLELGFKVSQLTDDGCKPLSDAIVDVWHANASGVYSGVPRQGTADKDFLRGIQFTDGSGAASFTTIYPGWYPGRAVHIHFKIRSSADATDAYELTSQLFFDDDLTDRVYRQPPYAKRGERDTLNSEDIIFEQGNPTQLLLALSETTEGYAGTLHVAFYTDGENADDDSFP